MKEAFKFVFNDDCIVVINKMVRILVHPSPKGEKNTLISLLQRQIGQEMFPCHRLDRETTGLIIYAKSRKAQKAVAEQFRNREVKKKYYAFVKGKIKKKQGVLRGYVLDKEGERHGEKPKSAQTSYRVVAVYEAFSLVELSPFTGRTNQLRIQLSRYGHPILGETRYAFRRDFPLNFRRLSLHAFFLNFTHPVSMQKVEIKIGLPEDMKEFLDKYISV